MTSIKDITSTLKNGQDIPKDIMESLMMQIMDGKEHNTDLADFLTALSDKGETAEEITAAAKILRARASGLNAPDGAVDCCGTGGDASGTYNISTAVAIVAAACGVPVAKHGNRAASSKSGAADVLEALGVNLNTPKDMLETALERFNFAFLMAPKHHSSMRHVAEVRKNLGRRTIFNLLGPLANPANTKFQLIGVFDKKWLIPMAETLRNLGTQRAWLVHGSDGLDEITVTGPTQIVTLDEFGNIENFELNPHNFGLETHAMKDLLGGDAQENATALRTVLNGEKNAYHDIVLANTAAVLNIQTRCSSLEEGVHLANEAIESGKALDLLDRYIAFTNE